MKSNALLLLAFAFLLTNCQKSETLMPSASESPVLPQLLGKKWVQTKPAETGEPQTFEPNDHFTPCYEFGTNNQVVYTYGALNGGAVCGVGLTDCDEHTPAQQAAAIKGTYRVESFGNEVVISLHFDENTFSKTWEIVSLSEKTLVVRSK
jgi:hypothetical protein